MTQKAIRCSVTITLAKPNEYISLCPRSTIGRTEFNKEYLSCRDTYGDIMSKSKNKGIMRVIFQNINGLGTNEESDKREYSKEFINNYRVDVMTLVEVNINWRIVGGKENLHTLTKKWFEKSRVVTANNSITSTKKDHQQGGVAIIALGYLLLKAHNTTVDAKRLCRWCSM